MTIVHSIDHELGFMRATASGPIDLEQVRTHLLSERCEGGLGYAELIEARSATPEWSSTQALEIVELLRTLGRESKLGPTAVVVSGDLAFGMLRMLEILLEDVCLVRPFRDCAAAEKWIREPPQLGV